MLASLIALETAASGDVGLDFLSQVKKSLDKLNSETFAQFLWDVLIGILIIVIGKLIIVFLTRMFKRLFARSKKINELMAKFLLKVITIVSWIVVLLVLLEHMGISMAPILAGLGVTGVILGFAFQESIGNLLSGVMIVINAPFRIGDFVDIGALSGTVSNMDLMCVILSTPDNKKITLSNKLVWGNPIVNYSYTVNRRVDMIVSVAYGTDLAVVKDVIRKVLSTYPEVLSDPAPIVEVMKLNDSSVDLIARPWVLPKDYWAVFWRFQKDIYDSLRANNLSIPFPQLDVHLYEVDKIGGEIKSRNPMPDKLAEQQTAEAQLKANQAKA